MANVLGRCTKMTKKFWVEQHKGHGELNVNNFRQVRVEGKLELAEKLIDIG